MDDFGTYFEPDCWAFLISMSAYGGWPWCVPNELFAIV